MAAVLGGRMPVGALACWASPDYSSIFEKPRYLIDNLINYCLDRKAECILTG
jgi:hypothetical protein